MTRFSVWAPEADRLRVRIGGIDHSMALDAGGWWRTNVECAAHGTDYLYLLDDSDEPLPDPRSRWQPLGVRGPSRTYDHAAYPWTDGDWAGRDLAGGVIYSVRVGGFTPDGTFDAAVARLDHLADLGVDAVELHPVNVERGSAGQSACWYTPHPSYGGPDGLKRFVDACHERGIAVVLDLAYDHLQPGAGAHRIGPYLAEVANTWGHSLALDGPHGAGMRSFITDNVLMWLRDYHADGVRLDAAHTLIDRDAMLLLDELSAAVSALSISLGRPLALIAGSGLAGARFIPGPGADLAELLAPPRAARPASPRSTATTGPSSVRWSSSSASCAPASPPCSPPTAPPPPSPPACSGSGRRCCSPRRRRRCCRWARSGPPGCRSRPTGCRRPARWTGPSSTRPSTATCSTCTAA
ncbi:hypothetical protein Psuf_008860 [Phytohabitans suffuscus]|uniref:Glycosyl hydrolase family 13 catalytic domain-containing protein n=1 Tax=Phytohabitans suffuscus TaxID=624315 RepID=A0A6F8YC19_9ACTN|nr:alpha-amylase family glycosyl hydrolase [Phytohabitans suffuscus]BCB83573.1 hypothetical protein Psuf_008860 [Phytohabitans suffuscus]